MPWSRSRALCLAAILFGLGASLFASRSGDAQGEKAPQAWKPPPTEFECRFTELPIKIDGKGDEAAWRQAQVIDNFYLPWLGAKARPARTKTTARLLWDREYLYFLADMEDTDLYADVKEHDGQTWDNDVFELFFKPADDKPGYYEFQVNAAGTVMDMFLPRRNAGGFKRFAHDGDFHVEAKVALRGTLNNWTDKDEGWTVEGKIPWKDFLRTGGRPDVGEKWKFALCRYDYSVDFEGPEQSTCAPLKSDAQANFHKFEDYATLRFTMPRQASLPPGLDERVPLTTSKVIGSPDPPLPFRAVKAFAELKLTYPIAVTHQPGSDRLLVITQANSYGATKIVRVRDQAASRDWETLMALTDVAYDIVFHPKFAENGYFYVGSNGSRSGKPNQTRVTRYAMDRTAPYRVDPASALVIIEWDSDGHNGGAMSFGLDGMFYVTAGDGTSDSDTNVVGQDMTKLLAKVLRIDVDHPEPGKTYAVPKDNPFVNRKDARPEIWALGLRNPWRMTVDRVTGHLWVGQNGQDLWEQAFLVKKGDNYGWSVTEGSHRFYPGRSKGPNFMTQPTVEHPHSEARSLTGGIVYYGDKFPELRGAYIYGDYSTGRVWAVKHDGQKIAWHKELCDSRLQITGFGVDARGEVLITDHRGDGQGGIYTLQATPKDQPLGSFPRTLSASGLFQSVKGHVMQPALVPYSVNSVLWSDGAFKERWLAIPGDGTIDFTTSRGWNFPDRTVIVKSFGLEFEQGNPASRRWIETRFLTRQGTEWFGYSYAWNDEQTEGKLVDKGGRDRDFVIKVAKSDQYPDGLRKQTWHYPSRTECMVCHSRAANWVLGLTEIQMNKVHNYGAVAANQLRVLERLGLLKVNWYEEARKLLRDEGLQKGMSEEAATRYVDKLCATRGQRAPVASSLLTRPPEKYNKMVDPYDKKQDLTLRARSYLQSNCAQCHVEAGGGNARMELEFTTKLDKMRVVNVKPLHDSYGIGDAKLIYPGHPEKSVLLRRISHRDKGHMPPLATSLVDQDTVQLMRDWIVELGK
jgi:glucose/arabinose dehydrogenase